MATWVALDGGTRLNLSQIVSITPIEVGISHPLVKMYALQITMSDGSVYTSGKMSEFKRDVVMRAITNNSYVYL